jgi:hypothetical protein
VSEDVWCHGKGEAAAAARLGVADPNGLTAQRHHRNEGVANESVVGFVDRAGGEKGPRTATPDASACVRPSWSGRLFFGCASLDALQFSAPLPSAVDLINRVAIERAGPNRVCVDDGGLSSDCAVRRYVLRTMLPVTDRPATAARVPRRLEARDAAEKKLFANY